MNHHKKQTARAGCARSRCRGSVRGYGCSWLGKARHHEGLLTGAAQWGCKTQRERLAPLLSRSSVCE
eukprot:2316146-Amphidinium_carterae.1